MRFPSILVSPALTIPKAELEHMERTGLLMGRFYDWMRQNNLLPIHAPPPRDALCRAAAVHDIGKALIPAAILNKPGKLTPAEFEVIKEHTHRGIGLLRQQNKSDSVMLAVCRHHHERWDGSGYPDELSGKSIPYPARLMAVVDVYDALTHERPYKGAYSKDAALQIIRQGCGTQFDPAIGGAFLNLME